MVYVFGGEDRGGRALSFVERYDAVSDTWSFSASVRNARHRRGACEVSGELFVNCGCGDYGGVLAIIEMYMYVHVLALDL